MPHEPIFFVVIAIVGLLIGLSKGGMGAAIVVTITPLLSLVMSVQDAISLALPLLLVADALALIIYWKTWDLSYVKTMLPPALIGIVIGTVLLASLPDTTMRRVLGLFTLTFVIYRLAMPYLRAAHYQPKRWHAILAGGASGLGSALANTGAPPFTMYMLLQPISPTVFVGTTTLFFALVNLFKLPGLILANLMDFSQALNSLWVVPIIFGGVFLGRWLIRRIRRDLFDYIMLAVLAIASAVLLLVPPR